MEIASVERLKNRYIKFLAPSVRHEWINRNKYIFNDPYRPVLSDRVNLFWTGTYKGEITKHENLGDYLSLVIVQSLLADKGLELDQQTNKTSYLYAIGSIIGFGYQDAVIWGSGLLNSKNVLRCLRQKLDIRAVRGPCTRNLLLRYGIDCPEIYGDPACLLSRYYYPKVKKKYRYSLILHHNSELRKDEKVKSFIDRIGIHYIEILTIDYKFFVSEILSSECVISSALHGIILSESYGIPTIFLRENLNQDIKFDDWYFSTGRYDYSYITRIEDISETQTNDLPDLSDMKNRLTQNFPYDLW
ncbi:MAG: polysaccharide pyruvyl transferase family protein [Lachnospiraceae bacterium]|nr:polysaccharide pyruvyl transferase family protein [Lachnospiraceae bacterium]